MTDRKQPSLARIRGGATAKRAGDDFQKSIYLSAKSSGVVTLEELPSCGAKFVGKGRIIRQNMPCDFIGTVSMGGTIRRGQGVFFDAKSIGEQTNALDFTNPNVVKPHQIDFLRAMAAGGALAGFLVECRRRGHYLWWSAHYPLNARTPWVDPHWWVLGQLSQPVDFEALLNFESLLRLSK